MAEAASQTQTFRNTKVTLVKWWRTPIGLTVWTEALQKRIITVLVWEHQEKVWFLNVFLHMGAQELSEIASERADSCPFAVTATNCPGLQHYVSASAFFLASQGSHQFLPTLEKLTQLWDKSVYKASGPHWPEAIEAMKVSCNTEQRTHCSHRMEGSNYRTTTKLTKGPCVSQLLWAGCTGERASSTYCISKLVWV